MAPPTQQGETLERQSFDYVIVGGGTAGLVLAARLSEDSGVSIAVLEAGGDHINDPEVLIPGLVTKQLENPKYDWDYKTVPQKHMIDNKVIGLPRGKQLGGSSAINFMYQTHASKADLDDWVDLGNEGWSWQDIFPYFLKSENFIIPSKQVAEDLDIDETNFDRSLHGDNGPIKAGFPRHYADFQKLWPKTFDNMGLRASGDPKGGLALGGYTCPLTHDTILAERSFSGNAYYKPVASRSNLFVFTDALAQRIVFDDSDEMLRAIGVEFLINGTRRSIKAAREVIVCCGSFGSPQLLELSGIGNKDLLEKHGIKVLYENSNVGENLQDHNLCPISFEANDDLPTNEDFKVTDLAQKAMENYQSDRLGTLVAGICSSALLSRSQITPPGKPLKGLDEPLLSPEEEKTYPGRAKQYELTKRKLLSPNDSVSQHIFVQGGWNVNSTEHSRAIFNVPYPGHFISVCGAISHPFSRGTVHIQSPDAAVLPAVDPAYLSHPLDVEIYAEIMLFAQKIARTKPFCTLLKAEATKFQPDQEELTEGNVRDHVRKYVNTEYHPIGTCAMQPREQGGVVDSRLKVYGTKNLRVVDASIFPLHVQANIVSLVYAVAEKAAEIIKEDAISKHKSITLGESTDKTVLTT